MKVRLFVAVEYVNKPTAKENDTNIIGDVETSCEEAYNSLCYKKDCCGFMNPIIDNIVIYELGRKTTYRVNPAPHFFEVRNR
jgi:hypothetical protein